MKIMGIDASTKKTGVAFFEDDMLKEHRLIDCSKIISVNNRMNQMILNIHAVINYWKPEYIAIENSWVGVNPKVSKLISEIIGGTRAAAARHSIDFIEYEPNEWRSLVGIYTKTTKREDLKFISIKMVNDKFKLNVNDDEADAILIAQARINDLKGEKVL